ncbi:MAG: hypothetical protein WCP17_03265 [bacterium]
MNKVQKHKKISEKEYEYGLSDNYKQYHDPIYQSKMIGLFFRELTCKYPKIKPIVVCMIICSIALPLLLLSYTIYDQYNNKNQPPVIFSKESTKLPRDAFINPIITCAQNIDCILIKNTKIESCYSENSSSDIQFNDDDLISVNKSWFRSELETYCQSGYSIEPIIYTGNTSEAECNRNICRKKSLF